MQLNVRLEHVQGGFRLQADFACNGRLLSVHGHSGAGKTTLLHLLAGLIRPSHGQVALAGRVLVDTQAGVFVPPRQRRIGYVFQERLLFPHLGVSANLNYGRHRPVSKRRFAELVELLDLGPLLTRPPATLSVGEQQRVAIGRALLAEPELLLLDEPLAAQDEARKQELLPYLARLRDDHGLPMVYVSHDRREIEQLADAEIRLERGRQVGGCAPLAPLLAVGDAQWVS